MKPLLVAAVAFSAVAFYADTAAAEDRGEIVTFGNRGAPGVAASAFSHGSVVPPRSSARPADLPENSRSRGVPVVIHGFAPVTNRCSATNLGEGFSYSFANGVECASFSAPSPEDPVTQKGRRPRPPSPEQVAAALFDRAVSLAPDPQLEVAPARVGLAGLRTFFWLAEPPDPIVATAAAGRSTITATASPVQFVWSFGDGTDRATTGSGRRWTIRRDGSIGHVYQASGRYDLGVEVVWQARWRAGGGSWRDLGHFSTSDSRRYPVREVLAWLVRAR